MKWPASVRLFGTVHSTRSEPCLFWMDLAAHHAGRVDDIGNGDLSKIDV